MDDPSEGAPRVDKEASVSSMEQQTDVRAAIEAATRQLIDAFGRRDAAGCASLYTEQGAMLPPKRRYRTGTASDPRGLARDL